MSCCPRTRLPALPLAAQKDYKPRGNWIKLSGGRDGKELRVYRVGKGDKAIILIHDIFGVDTGRHIAVCDSIALEIGCVVVAPCLFRGDACTFEDLGTPRLMEVVKRHTPSQLAEDFDCLYRSLGSDIKAIGLIGFCYGSWAVYKECGRQKRDARIKAGANFHPSLHIDEAFGGSVEECVEKAKDIPQLVCPCGNDKLEMAKTMLVSLDDTKFHSFETMSHGFMTQGDVSNEDIKAGVIEGVEIACHWFQSRLTTPKK